MVDKDIELLTKAVNPTPKEIIEIYTEIMKNDLITNEETSLPVLITESLEENARSCVLTDRETLDKLKEISNDLDQ